MAHDKAIDALQDLLWELPAEFSSEPTEYPSRASFTVFKESNVRKVHEALWELQEYFGLHDD